MANGLLDNFVADAGDFRFSCERDGSTIYWYRTLLNTAGAEPERVCMKNVPTPVLDAFARSQVASQATAVQNLAVAH